VSHILPQLTDPQYFPHLLAGLLVATWAMAIVTRPRGFYRPAFRGLVIVPLAVAPYLSAGLGLALLALGLLVVCANLDQRWLAWAPDRPSPSDGSDAPAGHAAGVAAGVVFLLGGVGLMALSGSGAWSWWIGAGTAAHGALIALTRLRGARDFGPWS
jgi:hypothetical protein